MPTQSSSLSPSTPILPSPAHSHHSVTSTLSDSNPNPEHHTSPANVVENTESPSLQRTDEWEFLPFSPIKATFAEAGALPPELQDDIVHPNRTESPVREKGQRTNAEMLWNKYINLGVRERVGGRVDRLEIGGNSGTNKTSSDDEEKASGRVDRMGPHRSRQQRVAGPSTLARGHSGSYDYERAANRFIALQRYAPYRIRKESGDGRM